MPSAGDFLSQDDFWALNERGFLDLQTRLFLSLKGDFHGKNFIPTGVSSRMQEGMSWKIYKPSVQSCTAEQAVIRGGIRIFYWVNKSMIQCEKTNKLYTYILGN